MELTGACASTGDTRSWYIRSTRQFPMLSVETEQRCASDGAIIMIVPLRTSCSAVTCVWSSRSRRAIAATVCQRRN